MGRGAQLVVFLYVLAGGAGVGYEEAWTQAFVPFLSTRAAACAIGLAVYLSGSLGSPGWCWTDFFPGVSPIAVGACG